MYVCMCVRVGVSWGQWGGGGGMAPLEHYGSNMIIINEVRATVWTAWILPYS